MTLSFLGLFVILVTDQSSEYKIVNKSCDGVRISYSFLDGNPDGLPSHNDPSVPDSRKIRQSVTLVSRCSPINRKELSWKDPAVVGYCVFTVLFVILVTE